MKVLTVIPHKSAKGWSFKVKSSNGKVVCSGTGLNNRSQIRRTLKSLARHIYLGYYTVAK